MVKRNHMVEIGRVVLVNYGSQNGKTGVVIDVVDQNRVLVDGLGIARQTIPMRHLALTAIKADVPRSVRTSKLAKLLADQDVAAKFAATTWGKKLAATQKRAALSDFDRFKVMIL